LDDANAFVKVTDDIDMLPELFPIWMIYNNSYYLSASYAKQILFLIYPLRALTSSVRAKTKTQLIRNYYSQLVPAWRE